MRAMIRDSIKKSVVESYGKLAKSTSQSRFFPKLFACCDSAAQSNVIGKANGYTEADLAEVPDSSNLGIGCGNPSALAGIRPGDTVVDLGSGAGFDAFIVSRMVGISGEVVGVDLSEHMLNLARRNARKGHYRNVQFIKGDIEELPLESEMANHVISNCVINLSLRKGLVFREAYRVLKAGGKLSISDIVLEKELPDAIVHSLPAHIACISGAEKLSDYLGYIRAAGFKQVKIEKETTFPLELMLTDPLIQKLSKEIGFNQTEAKEMTARVKSASITAVK